MKNTEIIDNLDTEYTSIYIYNPQNNNDIQFSNTTIRNTIESVKNLTVDLISPVAIKDYSGDVTFTLEDSTITTVKPDADGIIKDTYTFNEVGNKTIKFTSNAPIFTDANVELQAELSNEKVNVIIDDINDTKVFNDINIIGNITDKDANIINTPVNVTITLSNTHDKITKTITITGGQINTKLATDDLKAGVYTIEVNVKSDEYQGSTTKTVNLVRRDVDVTINTNTPKTVDELNINITLTDTTGRVINDGYVIIKINDVILTDELGNEYI